MVYEEMTVKDMLEKGLTGNCWERLKHIMEDRPGTENAVSTNGIVYTHLRWYLSNSTSNKKIVARDWLWNTLNYDSIISKIGPKSTADRNLRDKKLNEARQKLMLNLVGSQQMDMRGCESSKGEKN